MASVFWDINGPSVQIQVFNDAWNWGHMQAIVSNVHTPFQVLIKWVPIVFAVCEVMAM